MDPDLFVLTAAAIPADAKVLTFTGSEGLSRLYAFDVLVLIQASIAPDFEPLDALFGAATLTINGADGTPRTVRHGIVSSIELVHEHNDQAVYRVTLVPALWKLTLKRHTRVFTRGHDPSTVPDVIEFILRDAGITGAKLKASYENRGKYEARDHICQWRETDFDFVARWMEREGIYFYFEHDPDKSEEVLRITDTKSSHTASPATPVRYFPTSDSDTGQVDAMETWRARYQALAQKVILDEYDQLNPSLALKQPQDITTHGVGETRSLGDNYADPDDGKRLAAVRALEHSTREAGFHGRGRLFDLVPGYRFTLDEHPRNAMNAEYLCVEQEHFGNNIATLPELARALRVGTDRTYKVHVAAVSSAPQYRPARRTAVPRVYGVESATVDGPLDDDYAQLDKEGRYKVKVRFEERDHPAGEASMWIRMLQPHGGNPEGWHFPLRKGTEVMLVFLGGDPDRPIIAGVAPNAHNPSPVTSANHTQNVIHTGGDNEIRIEDEAEKQWIDIFSPPEKSFIHLGKHHDAHSHNWIISTDGNGLVHTGGQEDVRVGAILDEEVVGDVNERYLSNRTTDITGDDTRTVGGNASDTIGGNETITVGGNQDNTVGGNQTNMVIGNRSHAVVGNQSSMIVGNDDTIVAANQSLLVAANQTTTIAATQSITVAAAMTITTPALTINAASFTLNVPTTTKQGASESWFSPTKFEVTGLKNDHSGVNNAIDGLKIEHCGVHMSTTGVEISTVGMEKDAVGAKIEQLGAKLGQIGSKIEAAGARIYQGFTGIF